MLNHKLPKLLEPLRLLFKDEVRRLGEELGIAKKLVWRQPFPGPGLAVRCLGEITEEKLHLIRESDAILRDEIAQAGLEGEIWRIPGRQEGDGFYGAVLSWRGEPAPAR